MSLPCPSSLSPSTALSTLAPDPWEILRILSLIAVPVASRQAVRAVGAVADEVICPVVPARFVAVGLAYADFHQLTDQEVDALLGQGSA